jgi:hypothetical protein
MSYGPGSPPQSPFKYAAIVSLDPAGSGPSGVAVRTTAALSDVDRRRLTAPGFTYQGWVFESTFQDQLTCYLMRVVPKDAKVLLVVENCAYQSYKTARGVGRAIGAIEGLLHYCGLARADATAYVTPQEWRGFSYGKPLPKGRKDLKAKAVSTVEELYGMKVGPDEAEAILILDWATLAGKGLWK